MIHTRILALSVSLSAVAAAQHPCDGNLVPNGGFEELLSNPWTVTGAVVATPEAFATNAVDTSTCFRFALNATTPFTVAQTTPVRLDGSTTYVFSVDTWSSSRSLSLDVGLTQGGNRSSIGVQTPRWLYTPQYARIQFAFTPPATGTFALDLTIDGVRGQSIRVDNVRIRPARAAEVNFGPRLAGRSDNRLVVEGAPNRLFAMFLTAAGRSPVPLPVAGCSGEWLLGLPAFQLLVSSFDQNGVFATDLAVPARIAGQPLHFQAVALPPSCAFGCALRIAFP